MNKGDNISENELNELLRKLYLEEKAENSDEATAKFVMDQEYNVEINAEKEQQMLKRLSKKTGGRGKNWLYLFSSFALIGAIGALYFNSSKTGSINSSN